MLVMKMVARYRSRMALRPVNRIKHVVDSSASLGAGVDIAVNLIEASDAPVLAQTDQVVTGSKVHAIYLRVEVVSNENEVAGAVPNVYMGIQKNPGGNIGAIRPNAVGVNDNKRYMIHQEMTMIQNINGGNPRTIFNGVIVIPKGYQRFGPNDLLTINFFSPAVDFLFCIQAHYKEFR